MLPRQENTPTCSFTLVFQARKSSQNCYNRGSGVTETSAIQNTKWFPCLPKRKILISGNRLGVPADPFLLEENLPSPAQAGAHRCPPGPRGTPRGIPREQPRQCPGCFERPRAGTCPRAGRARAPQERGIPKYRHRPAFHTGPPPSRRGRRRPRGPARPGPGKGLRPLRKGRPSLPVRWGGTAWHAPRPPDRPCPSGTPARLCPPRVRARAVCQPRPPGAATPPSKPAPGPLRNGAPAAVPAPGDTARHRRRGVPAPPSPAPDAPAPPLSPSRDSPGPRRRRLRRGRAAPGPPTRPPAPPARRPWRSPRLRAPLAAPRPAEGRAGEGRGPPAAPHARRRQPPSLTYFPPGLPPDGAPLTYFPANGTLPRPRTGRARPPTAERLRARLAQWAAAERETPASPSAGKSPGGPAALANQKRGSDPWSRPPAGGGAEGRRRGAPPGPGCGGGGGVGEGSGRLCPGRRGGLALARATCPGSAAARGTARCPPLRWGSPEPLRHRRVTSAAAVTSRAEVWRSWRCCPSVAAAPAPRLSAPLGGGTSPGHRPADLRSGAVLGPAVHL